MVLVDTEASVNRSAELQARFKSLLAQVNSSPEDQAAALDYPSTYEVGLRHPLTGALALLRDDGAAELSAGPAANLLVDGPAGQVTMAGTNIALAAQNLHLHAPPGGLWIGFQRLNPWWQSLPNDPNFLWRTAPIVQNFPGSLAATPFVAGLPQEGQYNVSLSELLQAQPLFGPNEMLLVTSRKLATLLHSVLRL